MTKAREAEFDPHECSVCGSDCVAVGQLLDDLLAENDRLREVAETYSTMLDNACFQWSQGNDRLRAALREIVEHPDKGILNTQIALEALEQK